MSYAEAASCRLPLLDGEDTTEPQLITTELELENVETLQRFANGDVASFNAMLCTAWGLLLRCYTGQDHVSFYFRQGNVDDPVPNSTVPRDSQSTFQMAFYDQESLSTCVLRAKDGYTDDERGGPSLFSAVSDQRSFSGPYNRNTHVWVQGGIRKDMGGVIVRKVF